VLGGRSYGQIRWRFLSLLEPGENLPELGGNAPHLVIIANARFVGFIKKTAT
jgi:hypothetical protein